MQGGIQLTLMIGPAVPVPVPQAVLEALTSLRVTTTSGTTASVFELQFTLSKSSPLQTLFLLAGGAGLPLVRVVIVATVNGTPEVLMDGVMTNHQVTPGANGAISLTVTGEDLSAVMDYIDFSGLPYPAMPAEARVALILAKYAVFGVVPLVIPSPLMEVPIPIESIPRQQGKDLPYIRQLAEQVGYVFYVSPGPAPGMSVAYFGPEIKVGVPQPALNVDMDAHTNVESVNFSFNNQDATLPVVLIHNTLTKFPIPIPIPNVSLLNPPLGLVPPIPKNIEPIEGTAKHSPIRAALYGLSKAARSSEVVTASGTLDVLRYGRVLKARGLVGVRGVGAAFDGLYYVKSVTHNIKRGEYKQSFELTRNGLVSTVPVVPG
jgi:hypothetical protein